MTNQDTKLVVGVIDQDVHPLVTPQHKIQHGVHLVWSGYIRSQTGVGDIVAHRQVGGYFLGRGFVKVDQHRSGARLYHEARVANARQACPNGDQRHSVGKVELGAYAEIVHMTLPSWRSLFITGTSLE